MRDRRLRAECYGYGLNLRLFRQEVIVTRSRPLNETRRRALRKFYPLPPGFELRSYPNHLTEPALRLEEITYVCRGDYRKMRRGSLVQN